MRVRPDDPPAPTLALVAAVALHATLSDFLRRPGESRDLEVDRRISPTLVRGDDGLRIKWPNDIMAGGAKLAGILLERAGDAVVIGFGANLARHPGHLDRPVTSLAALSGIAPSAAATAERLAGRFADWLALWRGAGLNPIRAAWLAAAHPIGTRLSTPEGDGMFAGLNENGALQLRLAGGATRLVHAGDVFLL